MSIRGAIYTLLSGLEADVWPLHAEQETKVAHAVYFISREPIRSQDGNEFWDVKLRIEIYGADYDQVEALAAVFEADLDFKAQTTISGEILHVSNLDNENDDYIYSEQKFNITQEYTLKFY